MMTDLEKCKAFANELTRRKIEAQRAGVKTLDYIGIDGKSHRMYYHSGRWNDRPAKIGDYRGLI